MDIQLRWNDFTGPTYCFQHFHSALRHIRKLQQCFQGSVPSAFSFPSLLMMMPYSMALSRQFWAILETGSGVPSPPFARTERISRASLSMSLLARLFSACIMFWMMTTPRWRRSDISLSSSAWKISSQWDVWEKSTKQSPVSQNRKTNCSICDTVELVEVWGSRCLLLWSAYCVRDVSTQLRLLSSQHGQCSCSSLSQPFILLSAKEHKQLQAIIPSGQVQFLHLRTHQAPTAVRSSFLQICGIDSTINSTINTVCLTSVLRTKLHMHSVADARTRLCSSNM